MWRSVSRSSDQLCRWRCRVMLAACLIVLSTMDINGAFAQDGVIGLPHAHSGPTTPRVYGQPLAGHGPDCTCRAQGIAVQVGQSICMRLPGGDRIATCGMVLNNTSWQIGEVCPDS